jgi:hypothetical protein
VGEGGAYGLGLVDHDGLDGLVEELDLERPVLLLDLDRFLL